MPRLIILTLEGTSRLQSLSGGALRVLGLKNIFELAGYDVKVLRPDGAGPKTDSEELFTLEGVAEGGALKSDLTKRIRELNPDLLVVEQWGLLTDLEFSDCPLIVDLHGSLIFENYCRGYREEKQILAKLQALSRCQGLLVPGLRQYYYFLGMAQAAGLNMFEDRILHLPLILPAEFYPQNQESRQKTIVMGGGLWPWAGLEMAEEIKAWLTDQGYSIQQFLYQPHFKNLHENKLAPPSQAISHQDLIPQYLMADLALDFYPLNRERQLAITTRTMEYLLCGLPVIYNSKMELAPMIEQYQLGFSLDHLGQITKIKDLVKKTLKYRKAIYKKIPKFQPLAKAARKFKQFINHLPATASACFSLGNLETLNKNLVKVNQELKDENEHLASLLNEMTIEARIQREEKETLRQIWQQSLKRE